jgi:hypothetical protein
LFCLWRILKVEIKVNLSRKFAAVVLSTHWSFISLGAINTVGLFIFKVIQLANCLDAGYSTQRTIFCLSFEFFRKANPTQCVSDGVYCVIIWNSLIKDVSSHGTDFIRSKSIICWCLWQFWAKFNGKSYARITVVYVKIHRDDCL